MSWEMTTLVMENFSRVSSIKSSTMRLVCGSKPLVGSSYTNNSGSSMSARALSEFQDDDMASIVTNLNTIDQQLNELRIPAKLKTSREAEAILRRVKDGTDKPRPKTMFEPGQSVRVIDGPFADFNGVVEEVNYDKSRLQVSVLIFGRATPVELEFSQVEKE